MQIAATFFIPSILTNCVTPVLDILDNEFAVKGGKIIEMGRGTTILQSKGGVSGIEKEIIYCVVSRSEIGRPKKMVHEIGIPVK